MKYLEVTFATHPCNETVNDVVSALAGEIGFESFVEIFLGAQLFLFVCLFSSCGPAVRLSLLTVSGAQTCDQYQDDIPINNRISFYSQCVRFVPPHPKMFSISYTWGQNIFIHINYFLIREECVSLRFNF